MCKRNTFAAVFLPVVIFVLPSFRKRTFFLKTMAGFPKFRELCPPAMLYFVVSMFVMAWVFFQNLGHDQSQYTMGYVGFRVPNIYLMMAFKVLMILFWTYVLNLICRDGHQMLSWFMVMLPFLMALIFTVLVQYNQ